MKLKLRYIQNKIATTIGRIFTAIDASLNFTSFRQKLTLLVSKKSFMSLRRDLRNQNIPQAVLKCSSFEAKHSKVVSKFFFFFSFLFLTKANEIERYDYSSKNLSNDAFQFSVSVTELEFQPIGFIACHFFHQFYQKID